MSDNNEQKVKDSAEFILDQARKACPFEIHSMTKPYLIQAMKFYSIHQNKELEEVNLKLEEDKSILISEYALKVHEMESENTAVKLEVEKQLSMEKNFRNFIRSNHLSAKWDAFLAIAEQALKEN